MKVIDVLQVSGPGVVIVTDVRHRDVILQLEKGLPVQFRSPDGRLIDSALEGIELFGSPFNANKPFMFVLTANTAKTDIPIGSDVSFEAQ